MVGKQAGPGLRSSHNSPGLRYKACYSPTPTSIALRDQFGQRSLRVRSGSWCRHNGSAIMRACVCGMFGVLAVCGLSWGQAPPANTRVGANEVQDRPAAGQPPRTTTPARGDAASGGGSSADKQIAACLYLDGHKEIELARFAQPKLQTEQAKQFAEKMIREHTPGHETIKRFCWRPREPGWSRSPPV
jgi:Domain of unknown function (DUF4142)